MSAIIESKNKLANWLIDAWNELAHVRGEPVMHYRIDGGWAWIVVLEVLTYDSVVQIRIYHLESEAEAKQFLHATPRNPASIGVDSVHRMVGPSDKLDGEGMESLDHAFWVELLGEHGTLWLPHGPPPGGI